MKKHIIPIWSTNLIASIRERVRPTFLFFRILLWALVFAGAPLVVRAATITVTTLADAVVNGDGCSLREAIEATNTDQAYNDCLAGNGNDVIDFAVQGTIQLNTDLPIILESLAIQGPGRDLLVLDGVGLFSMFDFNSGGVNQLLEISDLTITRSFGGPVGPVWIRSAEDLTMTNVLVSRSGGSLAGAIYGDDAGVIRILKSTIRECQSNTGGGAISVNGGEHLFVQDSTLANNVAASGAGGAISASGTPFEVRRSTISGNAANGNGGGVAAEFSDGLLRSVTVVENEADTAGVGFNGGGLWTGTFSEVTLANTIVALNSDGSALPFDHPDLSLGVGTLQSLSYNWIGINTSAEAMFPLPGAPGNPNLYGDFVGTSASPLDPQLSALTDNGGPTYTHRPLAGSGVIDQGHCPVAAQDQRGYGDPATGRRAFDIAAIPNSSDGCDIGSFEKGASPL